MSTAIYRIEFQTLRIVEVELDPEGFGPGDDPEEAAIEMAQQEISGWFVDSEITILSNETTIKAERIE